MDTQPDGAHRLWRIGRWTLDTTTRELTGPTGVVERLPAKAAAVLLRLAEHAGDVVSRESLIAEVWDGNTYTGSRALTQTVWRLRRLLDADGGEAVDDEGAHDGAIRTISKAGYQLLLPAAPMVPDSAVGAATVAIVEPAGRPHRPASGLTWSSNRWPRQQRGLVVALILLAVATLLVLGWRTASQSAPRQEGIPAGDGGKSAGEDTNKNTHTTTTTGIDTAPPTPLTLLDGVEEYPAVSPDGRLLAYVWMRQGRSPVLRVVDRHDAAAPPIEIEEPGMTLARPTWLGPQRLAYARAHDAADCHVVAMTLPSRRVEPIADCFYERNLAFMDASPDGRFLALARHVGGSASVSIVLRNLQTGAERPLTHPAGGLDDSQMSFSRDGRQVAFVRSTPTVGDLYLADVASGVERRLTTDQAPMGGLAWLADEHEDEHGDGHGDRDERSIVFSAARDGGFALWRVSAAGGAPVLFSRAETATNLATLPGEPNAVAATLHRFSDTIRLLSLADGRELSAIGSSSRNLYAQACPDSGHVLFLSMRSGRPTLWTSDAEGGQQQHVPLPDGTPDPPGCDAQGRWATTVRAAGAQHDTVVIGRQGHPADTIRFDGGAGVNNAVWSLDRRSLIVASDRLGGADLWRLSLSTHAFLRLTDDQGNFGREVRTPSGLWLYYARLGRPGLWRRPLGVGATMAPAEAVTDALGSEDWGNWQWREGALWLVERGPQHDRIVRRDVHGGSPTTVLTLPSGWLRPYRSLSMATGGAKSNAKSSVLVASVVGPRQADVVKVTGPR